jgi:hypothetical protein
MSEQPEAGDPSKPLSDTDPPVRTVSASVDDGIAFCRDEVLPMCRDLPGCLGLP